MKTKKRAKKTTLTLDLVYDAQITNPESLATAMDRLLETALSPPDIFSEYGDPKVGQFFVAPPPATPRVIVDVLGGNVQAVFANMPVSVNILDHDNWKETTDPEELKYFEGLERETVDLDQIY